MKNKKWPRYLVIPGIACIVGGTVLMFLRLGIEGIAIGGLLFAAGVDVFFIGASRPRIRPLSTPTPEA